MKTFVEINGTVYEIVPQRFGIKDWEPSCNKCAATHILGNNDIECTAFPEWNCADYDTDTYGVHLERLAKPSISLITPSEARREAAMV